MEKKVNTALDVEPGTQIWELLSRTSKSDKPTHPLARCQQQVIPKGTEKRNYQVLPLYYRFVIQFSLWCPHDGKFLPSNLAQSWILHRSWDSADELWEHSTRWKQRERSHCVHRWLSRKQRQNHYYQYSLKWSQKSMPRSGSPHYALIPCSAGTRISFKILVAGPQSFPLKWQLLFTRDVLSEPAFSTPFRRILLTHQLVLNSSRKLSCSKVSPKTNRRKADVYHLILRSVGRQPG